MQQQLKNMRKSLETVHETQQKATHQELPKEHQPDKLENMVNYLSSKLVEERQKYNETVSNIEKTFSGLMNKIGALEGVISELHAHHEQHEIDHEVKERDADTTLNNNGENDMDREDPNIASHDTQAADSQYDTSTVLLVIASSDRPEYLKKSLYYISKYHPKNSFPIMISEDGESSAVEKVVKESFDEMRSGGVAVPLVHVHHPEYMTRAENGYFKLSRHFKWALNELFTHPLATGITCPRRALILEEDLQIAPDFFEFFKAVTPMVDSDKTVLAASAWNDNGVKGYVRDAEALYRSDFFPGLGWMLPRRIWNELSPIWPNAYWDDWLREPLRRKGRHIIRPEICRTYHFGSRGVSNNQYSKFLDDIQLNEIFVPFSSLDLKYLENKRWEKEYVARVLDSPKVEASVVDHLAASGVLKTTDPNINEMTIYYKDLNDFARLARLFGVMDNVKAKVPRTAYHGIVSFWLKDTTRKVHLAPVDLSNPVVTTTILSDTDYDQPPSNPNRRRSHLRQKHLI